MKNSNQPIEITDRLTPPAGALKRRIFKVSELTREIRFLLEDRFSAVWVEGEISNFKHHSSKHMYFTLKDAHAQLNCVFFRGQNQFLKFDLGDGLKVIAIGRVSVYDVRGSYQLYVERIEPRGVGALQLAFLQLKEKLEKEGLFEEARKRAIPEYPARIGIITSPTGAAIQDMLKVFQRSRLGPDIFLMPTKVQGKGAALEIAAAIQALNHQGNFDLLVVGRGGGSLEDLWAFNEEVLARAIAASRIPVISAVGHEIDWTISDFVADERAHTPTAAAERVMLHWEKLEEKLTTLIDRLRSGIENIIDSKKNQLQELQSSYAFRQPLLMVQNITQKMDELARQLQNYSGAFLEQKKAYFKALAGQLNALSPLAVLERGYSITISKNQKVIRRFSEVQVGDEVLTRLATGQVKSRVLKAEA